MFVTAPECVTIIAPPSAPPFIAPSAARTLRFRPPLLRRSNQKNNKAIKVALLFTTTHPNSSGRSASVREVECWSTLVDQPRNASNTSSVFRCMLLKQTPVCCNSFQFADNACVLEITIRHPDFNNTEILLRRNSYPIYMRNDI